MGVGGTGVRVAAGGEGGAGVRLALGCTTIESVGALGWVSVCEASGETTGTRGADVDTEVHALITITIAMEAKKICEGFIFINRRSRTSASIA